MCIQLGRPEDCEQATQTHTHTHSSHMYLFSDHHLLLQMQTKPRGGEKRDVEEGRGGRQNGKKGGREGGREGGGEETH